jgi:ribosomal protein L21E
MNKKITPLEEQIPLITTIRLSEKVTLNDGDKVKVTLGPYYPSKMGTKICMGYKGMGTFMSASEDGLFLRIRFGNGMENVYIGPEYVSEATGNVMRPHKITKLRKK